MKNPNPLERDIEKAVCAYAKTLGILHYKFTSPARRSVPDRLMINCNGVVFFAEFKRLGQKPTAGQEVEIEKIRAQNVVVLIIDNVESGKRVIQEMAWRDPAF